MESALKQATLGKMAMRIKVTDWDGNRISFGKATCRHFGKFISGIILGIGYIMVAFTQKKQGLHDIMSGCLVVNSDHEIAMKEKKSNVGSIDSPTNKESGTGSIDYQKEILEILKYIIYLILCYCLGYFFLGKFIVTVRDRLIPVSNNPIIIFFFITAIVIGLLFLVFMIFLYDKLKIKYYRRKRIKDYEKSQKNIPEKRKP
jgi:multisubunit Na+/H+ antiporter MnhC subunit